MSIKQMQGVPAQLETLHVTDHVRRHPSKCIFVTGKRGNYVCTCPLCLRYLEKCVSSKCDNYEEK